MNPLLTPVHNRPWRRLALAGLLVAPAIVAAAPDELASQVVIECQQMHLPSQRAVSQLLAIDNLSQAYLARAHLMEDAKRACSYPGTERVLVLPRWQEEGRAGVN